jgi:polysaccharide export outer membrane protein
MFKRLLIFCALILSLPSCKLREKIVYFNDSDSKGNSEMKFSPILQVDDLISIVVSDIDQETVALFNSHNSNGQSPTYLNGVSISNGYLIDLNGEINLPIVGKIRIAGLKRNDAIILIENELKKYLNNPVVQLNILNFKVTVLGEVNLPGTYRIPNERITILEILGLAGDLKISGLRKNILVIREENYEKKEYRLDLTSKEIFNSPAYYLKQNDVVYVEPNMNSRVNSTFLKSNSPIFISITSIILSTIILITK